MVFRPSLQGLTLAASVLSCLATFAALYFVFSRRTIQQSLRHALVINLLVAEFINSTNNTISGIISLINRGVLHPGAACTANGFIGQSSVQAIDFGVLSIAISTFCMVIVPTHDARQNLTFKVLCCSAVWFFGLLSSSIIAGLDAFGPVSGNWCWIKEQRLDLRYALAHGWRFAIIFAIIVIYAMLAIRLGRHFGWLQKNGYGATSAMSSTNPTLVSSKQHHQHIPDPQGDTIPLVDMANMKDGQIIKFQHYDVNIEECKSSNTPGFSPSAQNFPKPKQTNRKRVSTAKQTPGLNNTHARVILMMTAYPVTYILLWIPGIANRVVEAMGNTSVTLQYMQASTQLLGLVDTMIFAVQYRRAQDH